MNMILKTVYSSAIDGWDVWQVPFRGIRYPCNLCGKTKNPGDWVMIRQDNVLLICAYEVPNAAS